jgi:CheY-like chemotaxis protein
VKLPVTITKPQDITDAHPAVGEDRPAVRSDTLHGIHVLAVEDDADSLELLRTVLASQGARVTTAVSAKDALATLNGEMPDIILSDIEMADGDGYSLVRDLRSAPFAPWRSVPIVAVTAYSRVEDRIRLLSAGFNMHLPKPVDPSELAAVITSLTRRGEK